MAPYPWSRRVAGGSGLLGVLGLVAASRELQYISEGVAENRFEGTGVVIVGGLVLLFLVSSLLTLGEAGVVAAAVTWAVPTPRVLRFLVAGAVSGGVAILFRALLTPRFGGLGQVFVWPIDVSSIHFLLLVEVWWVFATLGVFLTGLGLLLHVVSPLNLIQERVLQLTTVVVLIAVVRASLLIVLFQRTLMSVVFGGVGVLGIGILCCGLGGLLYAVRGEDWAQRGGRLLVVLAPGIALLGLVLAVILVLSGAPLGAALIILISLGMLGGALVAVRPDAAPEQDTDIPG